MISCQTFRANAASREPEYLEHLRKCDACLDYAVAADPDHFFRAIGGEELEPPGGIDAFTADVMAQVRLRETEGWVARRLLVPPRRLAVAAMIVFTIGALFFASQTSRNSAPPHPAAVAAAGRPVTATKPIVETYQSNSATIVEMPSQGSSDANVVMIFDESLPADL